MLWPFGFLQWSADAIVRAPRDRRPQMHGLHPERSDGLHSSPLCEACPQVLVDDCFERPARASRLGLKPRGDIFVQRHDAIQYSIGITMSKAKQPMPPCR